MNLEELKNWYSAERIESYRKFCKNNRNDDEVKELYMLNEVLSVCFFNLISNIEIILRNRVHKAIQTYYEPYVNKYGSWFECNENEIANIFNFNLLKDNDKNDHSKKITSLTNKINNDIKKEKFDTNYIATHKEYILISRLDFGFWNYIVSNNIDNYDFLRLISNKHIPNNKFIAFSKDIDKINKLRNRIAHHENIIKNVDSCIKHYNYCKSTLDSIDNSLTKHVLDKCYSVLNFDFEDVLQKINKIHI